MKMPHPTKKAEQGTPSSGNPITGFALTPAQSSAITMSSREIAEYVGTSHDSVLKTVRQLAERGVVSANETRYIHHQNGQTYPEFQLSYRDTMVVVSGYSVEVRAQIIDRWQELEAQAAPALPQTWAQALRLAAEQAEQLEQQQAQLALAAPKVAFVDRYVATPLGAMGFRQVCKLLEAKENQFRDFLLREKIMYYLESALMPHAQHHPATGRFVVRAGAADSGHKYKSAKFSPKGVAWIAGLWEKECQRLAEAGGA